MQILKKTIILILLFILLVRNFPPIIANASEDNTVPLHEDINKDALQASHASVTTTISTNAITGLNTISGNTGTTVSLISGDAVQTTKTLTALNANKATVTCNCSNTNNSTTIAQVNSVSIETSVQSKVNTGENEANSNTANDVMIHTGKGVSTILVENVGNINELHLKSNEAFKKDSATYGNENFNSFDKQIFSIVQYNQTDNNTNINYEVVTGKNVAQHNAGGNVTISTSDARVETQLSNVFGFNSVTFDCGCIGVSSTGNLLIDQGVNGGNITRIENFVNAQLDTGNNHADENLADISNPLDPVIIITGNTSKEVEIKNVAGLNFFSEGNNFSLPENFQLHFTFDISDVISSFHFI